MAESPAGLDAPGLSDALRRAIELQRIGRLTEADRVCSDILKVKPDHFDARHLLGLLRHQQGRSSEAIDLLAGAARLRPDAIVLSNYGLVLQDLNRHAEALSLYDQALALGPDRAELHSNRATALIELRRFAEAVTSCERALKLRPSYIEALFNRGIALHELKRYEAALASFAAVIALQPHFAEAYNRRGAVLMALERHEAALADYDRAITTRPDYIEALYNRGVALDALKRPHDALAAYERVLTICPTHVLALNNRGILLDESKRHAEAVASYDRALAIKPDYAEAFNNRGTALVEIERYDEAMASYDAALAIDPDYVECRWNRSLLLLRRGAFTPGWREYEWRRKRTRWVARDFGGQEWDGRTAPGRRLLFYAEQGLGDTIQFARFAQVVATGGGEVFLEVQPALRALLSSLEGVKVIAKRTLLPPYDDHLPLMSLPHVLGTTLATLPADVPYLSAEPARVERWSQRLPRDGFKVGIVWQGNPNAAGDKGRSIPLGAYSPLAQIPGVHLISLQKNDGTEQLRALPSGMRIQMLGPDFDAGDDAFLDSAAVIMNLDLVVTSDTAMAHLAGALGRPVFIALKRVPDWRFMIEGDSPWYPTARLFRQSRDGDWSDVFNRIAAEIKRRAGG